MTREDKGDNRVPAGRSGGGLGWRLGSRSAVIGVMWCKAVEVSRGVSYGFRRFTPGFRYLGGYEH